MRLQRTRGRFFPVERGPIRGKRVVSLGSFRAMPSDVRILDIVRGVDPGELEIRCAPGGEGATDEDARRGFHGLLVSVGVGLLRGALDFTRGERGPG